MMAETLTEAPEIPVFICPWNDESCRTPDVNSPTGTGCLWAGHGAPEGEDEYNFPRSGAGYAGLQYAAGDGILYQYEPRDHFWHACGDGVMEFNLIDPPFAVDHDWLNADRMPWTDQRNQEKPQVQRGTADEKTPDYYKGADALQPFDVIDAWDLDFYEGNVVKYLLRWRRKNKLEDLDKAVHYLQCVKDRAGE